VWTDAYVTVKKIKLKKQYSIRGSRVIPQRTTNRTQSSLSSEIGREPEVSGWYDRTIVYDCPPHI
jgi:hypothetical protein